MYRVTYEIVELGNIIVRISASDINWALAIIKANSRFDLYKKKRKNYIRSFEKCVVKI